MDETLSQAIELQKAGQAEQAATMLEILLEENPDDSKALHFLGLCHYQQGLKEQGLREMQQAVELEPDMFAFNFNLASSYMQEKKYAEAASFFQQAIRLNRESLEAHSGYAAAMQAQGNEFEYFNGLGCVNKLQNKMQQAINCFKKAISLKPESLKAKTNLAKAYYDTGHFVTALQHYQALCLQEPTNANYRFTKALLNLTLGNFSQAWEDYEFRHKVDQLKKYARDFAEPTWQGESLKGKRLLVYCEQGRGDTIQFIRYMPLLKEQGATVIVETRAELFRLLKTAPGIDEVVIVNNELPGFDYQIPMLSIPGILQTTLDTIPNGVPYFDIKTTPVDLNSLVTSSKPKVGMVWQGGAMHRRNKERSLSIDEVSQILAVQEVQFFCLQYRPEADVLERLKNQFGIVDLNEYMHDLYDTAGLIQQMDLVISVDTAMVHLAGALNVPVWNLITFVPDFRWLLKRSDSPWYPSMRLLRQKQRMDWSDVIAEVKKGLVEL